MRYSRRQVIKQGALLSVAGAAAACAAPASPPATDANSQAKPTPAASFACQISIHGAYGLIKRNSGGRLTVASLAHPAAGANPCNFDYSKHAMLLVLKEGSLDPGLTTFKPTVGGGITSWKLTGAVTLKGATPGFVLLPSASAETNEYEPYAPTNPANEWAWNDFNYVPSMGKAAATWQSRADATFDLPAGTLRVLAPPNAYGRIGRWKWPGNAKRSRAISDMVVVESTLEGSLTLTTPQGDIALVPTQGKKLSIEIVSELNPAEQIIKAGDPLEHLAMLYDFIDPTLGCGARPVPVYEKITGRPDLRPDQQTPGVECPLGFFDEP